MLHSFIFRLISLVFVVFFLSDCSKVTESHFQVNPKLASPYTMPAAAYLALANNQQGIEQQSMYIMAAGRLVYEGQWRQALQVLAKAQDLTPELSNQKHILLAKIDLMREQPKAALSQLAAVQGVDGLPLFYQVQYHEMLAHAYQTVGNPLDAVRERIKLGRLLPDMSSKANNVKALWLSITQLPDAELNTLAVEAPNHSELEGWMQLAQISRRSASHPEEMLAALRRWRTDHPEHPGNYMLPNPLDNVTAQLFDPPRQIALLLPTSGPLAGPGEAVRDGFMAAYQSSAFSDKMTVRLYNTDGASIEKLYHQAIQEGANYVVGPLSKPDVAAIAAITHPVPTVLLNDLDVPTKDNAYQFGLSPTNEARQVAVKARKNGHAHALIIAPAGQWGDEIVAAFAHQWTSSGGEIVDELQYAPQGDLTAAVREFLHVSESEARGKRMKQVLGKDVQLMPSRRQDFDVIFLLAYPSKARQIVPLLKYYFAGDVPVYATSSVYSGNADTMKDRDLNGVQFGDMPWVFAHNIKNKNWPEQFNSYNRLYALGMDSFDLSTQLNQLVLFPAMGVSDNSGVLYLSPNQHIARILAWGQFRQGVAQEIKG